MERKTKLSFSQKTTKIIHAKTNFRKCGRLGNKAKKKQNSNSNNNNKILRFQKFYKNTKEYKGVSKYSKLVLVEWLKFIFSPQQKRFYPDTSRL